MHRDLPLALNYGLTWPWRKQTFQERATAALKLMSNRGNETLVPFRKKKKSNINIVRECIRFNLINLWLIG